VRVSSQRKLLITMDRITLNGKRQTSNESEFDPNLPDLSGGCREVYPSCLRTALVARLQLPVVLERAQCKENEGHSTNQVKRRDSPVQPRVLGPNVHDLSSTYDPQVSAQ
jgi:hypothetical protein